MPESVDKEIDAIKMVLAALEPLSENVRANVIDYVLRRLGPTTLPLAVRPTSALLPPPGPSAGQPPAMHTHIKELKTQKKPRSANEMAVLVAYYLANMAPHGELKQSVNAKDVENYFKIAGFPLPEHIKSTLPNAKSAGYFDLVGEGEYRLNPVGYNLVVHSMPRGATASSSGMPPRESKTAQHSKSRTKKSP